MAKYACELHKLSTCVQAGSDTRNIPAKRTVLQKLYELLLFKEIHLKENYHTYSIMETKYIKSSGNIPGIKEINLAL